jgi:hypothetical protein
MQRLGRCNYKCFDRTTQFNSPISLLDRAGTIQFNIKGYATIQPLQFNITARQAGTIQYNIKGYATIQPLQFNITARQAGTIQ